MNQELKFAIEAWVTYQQDNKARNWVLDYTPPLPGEAISPEERLTELRILAVQQAIQPGITNPVGITTGESFHKQLLYHIHEQGIEFKEFRISQVPIPLQRTLAALAHHIWPIIAGRIENNLRDLQAKWSLPQAV